MTLPPEARQLAAWGRHARGAPLDAVAVGLGAAALVGAGWLSREGTTATRLGGAALLVAWVLWVGARWLRARRERADFHGEIVRGAALADRGAARRLQEALGLWARHEREAARLESLGAADATARPEPDAAMSEHPALVEAHVARLLRGELPAKAALGAARVARRRRLVALGLAAAAVAGFVAGPSAVLQGLDVLVARAGRAPVAMSLLGEPSVTARLPSYLGGELRTLPEGIPATLPVGTELRIGGVSRVGERELALTDGQRRVPFRADGGGAVFATWLVSESAELETVALFGEVLVPDRRSLRVTALPDAAPAVRLSWRLGENANGEAPAEVKLAEGDRLELAFAAEDDHGLQQVALVLRAGGLEERRSLERVDGEQPRREGSLALRDSDKFFRRAAGLPVTLRIAARDNDGVLGSKWGESPPLVVLLAPPGEAEAARLAVLRSLRGEVTRGLARALGDGTALNEGEVLGARLDAAARETFARGRTAMLGGFLRAESAKLRALPEARPERVAALEASVLALDSAVQALGLTDARTVSVTLGQVAEQVAGAAHAERVSERVEVPLDGPLAVLKQGARQLRDLGPLGADLGAVATADLARLDAARAEGSLRRVEVVARHIAERLRRPNPSFGARGSGQGKGGGPGGVEAGGGGAPKEGDGHEGQELSDFEKLARQLEQLAMDHAVSMAEGGSAADQATREKRLAERARELGGAPKSGAADALGPAASERLREAAQKMDQAARELAGGADQAGEATRASAQEALERLAEELTGGEGAGGGDALDQDAGDDGPDGVPGRGAANPAEAFRRRAMEGLRSDEPGASRDSLERYLEGLLR